MVSNQKSSWIGYCANCGKKSNYLVEQENISTGKKEFICEECGEKYAKYTPKFQVNKAVRQQIKEQELDVAKETKVWD